MFEPGHCGEVHDGRLPAQRDPGRSCTFSVQCCNLGWSARTQPQHGESLQATGPASYTCIIHALYCQVHSYLSSFSQCFNTRFDEVFSSDAGYSPGFIEEDVLRPCQVHQGPIIPSEGGGDVRHLGNWQTFGVSRRLSRLCYPREDFSCHLHIWHCCRT